MKKRLIFSLLAATALMAGCSEGQIYYEDNLRNVSEVEEILADQLEVENPEMDLEVNIYQETED